MNILGSAPAWKGSIFSLIKWVIAVASLSIVLVGLGVAWLADQIKIKDDQDYRVLEATAHLAAAESSFWRLRLAVPQYMVATPGEQQQILLEQLLVATNLERQLKAYEASAMNGLDRTLVGSAYAAFEAYREARQRFFELWQGGDRDGAINWRLQTLTPLANQAVASFGQLIDHQKKVAIEQRSANTQRFEQQILLISLTMLLALLTLGFISWLMIRFFEPLRLLDQRARDVLLEQFGADARTSSDGNELVALAWNVNQMSDRLVAYTKDLAAHEQQLEALLFQRTQELKKAVNLLRESVSSITQGFTIYDENDCLYLCNETYLSFYETSRDLIVPGASFEEIIRKGAERGQYQAAIGQVDEWVKQRVNRHQNPDGLPLEQHLDDGRWLLISEFRTPSGYFVGNRVDITELKETQRLLGEAKLVAEKASHSKSAFLANMSHEIRTPMTAIIGMADLALGTDLNERQRNYVGKIRIAADALLSLINDILDFSKIEAGKLTLEAAPFVLETVFDQLSSVLSLRAERQGVELAHQIDDDSRLLVGDPLRLGQVLLNLVGNALKFSTGGNVLVRATVLGETSGTVDLQFSVSDEGIGMTETQLESLFQPFTQADVSTTRKYGGTGLGLSISKELVELMGGRIWAESVAGQGSTFHFTARFPVRSSEQRQGVGEMAAKLAEHAERPVLVVDDNPLAREVLSHLIRQLGLAVHVARSGVEALEFLERDPAPDYMACLIDWHMSEMDGLETIRRLRMRCAERSLRPPAMLLVTAHSHEMELRGKDASIDGLLAKPVSARNLYAELARSLGVQDVKASSLERHKRSSLAQWSRYRSLDILLVEDVEINQEVIQALLGNVGLSLRVVSNGAEALAAVTRQRPDLILMDCHMPIMDGYEATRRLRADPEFSELPIIALTANAQESDQQKCYAAGMNAHVAKPIRMEALLEKFDFCLPGLASTPLSDELPQREHNEAPEELPDLPGIDIAVGLAHVGGRQMLYRRLLKHFGNNRGRDFPQQFSHAQAAGDREAQLRLAHTLKGISDTLGALDLKDAASALQGALEAEDAARSAELFLVVQEKLSAVTGGIAALGEQDGADLEHAP